MHTTTKGDGDRPMALRPVSLPATSPSTLPINSHVSEDPTRRQTLNPGIVFDDTAITVLVIGPRGHGKSSFIHRLMHLPGRPTGDFVQQLETKDPVVVGPVTVYEAEISPSEYRLIHKVTDAPYNFPSVGPGVPGLTHDNFRIGLAKPNTPHVKLRLVEGKFNYSLSGMAMVESMNNFLATLRKLPVDLNESWNGAFDAVTLVHKTGPDISVDCQRGLLYFEAVMPELFTRASAVNTYTNPGLAEATLKRVREARIKELGSLFTALNKEQNHIFIDNLPSAGLLHADFLACLGIHKLLSLWTIQKGFLPPPHARTSEMRLAKTPGMQQVDSLMAKALDIAVVRWKAQMQNLKERCAKQEEEVANAEVDLKNSIMLLSESEADFAKYNTEEKVWLSTYSTGQSMSLARTTRRIFSGKRKIRITEPYDDFGVEWGDSDSLGSGGAKWLDDAEYDRGTRTWKRGYEVYVQGARLSAKSYVLKRIKHREDIQRLLTQKSTLLRDIPLRRKKVNATNDELDRSRKEEGLLESYEERIEVVSSWEKELASKELPVGKTFNEEERKRYAMSANDLLLQDLYAFIQAMRRSSLVRAIRRVLGNPPAARTPLHAVLRLIEIDHVSRAAIAKMPLTT